MKTWFQASRQRPSASVRPDGGREQGVRVWLVGSFLIGGCVLALLVYRSGRHSEPTNVVRSASGESRVEPGPAAPRAIARAAVPADRESGEAAPLSFAPDANPAPVQVAEETVAEPVAIDPTAFTEPGTLGAFLRSADPVLGAAVFQAVRDRDRGVAEQALLEVVTDAAEPRRLQALELLVGGNPDVTDESVKAALTAALHDPDTGMVTYAVQELGGRSDAGALGLLAEVLDSGELSTKLLVVQSVAGNSSADALLQQGARDPDDTVRSAAKAVLSLRSQSKPVVEEAM